MDFSYTRHQTPRGARADAEVGDSLYLIKLVSHLKLTYQIRVLAFIAETRNKKLVIQLPKNATMHNSLRDFISQTAPTIKIERV